MNIIIGKFWKLFVCLLVGVIILYVFLGGIYGVNEE